MRPGIRPWKNDLAYLSTEEEINIKRFEFYVYKRISKMIDSGRIYITESEKNRHLEDDLISIEDWENKNDFILKTGLSQLQNPIKKTLTDLDNQFNKKLIDVTNSINTDSNEFVKVMPRSSQLTWTVANKRWKASIDNPIYQQVQQVGIIDIMNYANRETGYLNAFTKASSVRRNIKPSENDLVACIFGNGANYGLHKIASVSDRDVGSLRTVNDVHIRPETTNKANDLISNAIAKLPIFKYFTINETAPLSSIDGQKHACRINTFKARFSAKYFRKGKGVSALTLVSNHVPIKTAVISPNEYEGHFAFDLLFNNTSDISPKMLTTDTHGINNVNFAILNIFGYQFAPRYAKFKNAFYDQFEIDFSGDEIALKLKKPFDMDLIEEEWESIQRIICSLSRKTAKQSTIIKKLSNNKRNSRTLSALHEYDRIIKCLYFLEYIDNRTLRHFVQQALNRGEAYHQLRRTIASINGNQFRGGSDYQIEQWNDCARLIANCIIYYNSALLSALVKKYELNQDQKQVELITSLSPAGWIHIQLGGNYNFGEELTSIDLKNMLGKIDLFDKE